MSYQYITAHDAAAYHAGREGARIDAIVIHQWDDPSRRPTFDGVISWFKNPRAGVSAHYVVEAGRVACLVNEADTAYHAGDWGMNTRSIGIECNPRCSPSDLATVRELVQELLQRYPGASIIAHRDVVSTDCPGRYYAHLDYLRGITARPVQGKPTTPKRIDEDQIWGPQTTRGLQEDLGTPVDGEIWGQWGNNRPFLISIGAGWIFDNGEGSTVIRALQRFLGVVADGILGSDTVKALQRFLGVAVDGILGPLTVLALQRAINAGKFRKAR